MGAPGDSAQERPTSRVLTSSEGFSLSAPWFPRLLVQLEGASYFLQTKGLGLHNRGPVQLPPPSHRGGLSGELLRSLGTWGLPEAPPADVTGSWSSGLSPRPSPTNLNSGQQPGAPRRAVCAGSRARSVLSTWAGRGQSPITCPLTLNCATVCWGEAGKGSRWP